MTVDKSDVFMKSWIFRKIQRRIKEKLSEVVERLPVADLRYAVEANMDIVGYYLGRTGMSQSVRRKKIKPWKNLLSVITADDVLAIIREVSQPHAQVFTNHRSFFDAQYKKLREDLDLEA